MLSVSYYDIYSNSFWFLLLNLLSFLRFALAGPLERRGTEHFLAEQGWVFRVARFNTVQNKLINDGRQKRDRDIMRKTRGRSRGGEEEGQEGRWEEEVLDWMIIT